ncbi:Ppx/GppA family phosphatase [Altererythrobacter aquiaggeris]|uniref:Ppx/GppA phosphatase family protein n=1 Tax=Aestuarierythrobacter aquiaggeris TaxID=1898396 RepID=UPI00301AA6A7
MPRSQRRQPGRALSGIVDIGSNTVRLVIYDGAQRTPSIFLNEKITAQLGRELADTGRIPDTASKAALAGLGRYALLLADLGVEDVQVAATAAAREASNGSEFLAEVRKLGFEPRLLSGDDEARASAMGVIGAFPGARGMVADIGGGSLELAWIENGSVSNCTSLPLGTLRLPALADKGKAEFKAAIRTALENSGWGVPRSEPLYLVGGTWRALATYVLHHNNLPLSDPHGVAVAYDDAVKLAKQLTTIDAEEFAGVPGLSAIRAEALPNAAQLMRVMLKVLQPSELIVSAWGLREGLLLQRLDDTARSHDPLSAGVTEFCQNYDVDPSRSAMMAGWCIGAVEPGSTAGGRERLAATMLSVALSRVEPNLRHRTAMEWGLDKRWIGLDPRGRALLASALLGSCGTAVWPKELERLASRDELGGAAAWGLANRLCRRLGAGSRMSLMSSHLSREGKTLTLQIEQGRAALVGENTQKDLAALADFLGLETRIQVVEEIRRRQ